MQKNRGVYTKISERDHGSLSYSPTLQLSPVERECLRRAGVKLKNLSLMSADKLELLTNLPFYRCEELVELSQLQGLVSVGPSIALDMWILGYRSVDMLCSAHPHTMYNNLCRLLKTRVDPCVEDVFRCAIAQARNPNLPAECKNWWYWTPYRGTDQVDPCSPQD